MSRKCGTVLSPDEDQLITAIIADSKTFKQAYKLAWEDAVITQSEKIGLTSLWQKIYDASFNIAQQDKIISDDEQRLLTRIMKTIL